MRALLQCCVRGAVRVEGEVVGAIGAGLVVLVGTTHGDTDAVAELLGRRVAGYRIFPDADGRTNCSLRDVGGAALVVSQFTLYADTKKGTRPSFGPAGPPEEAQRLIARFEAALEGEGVPVQRGRFGAAMQVELVNDGPFTVLLEAEAR